MLAPFLIDQTHWTLVEISEYNFDPSVVLISLDHQEEDLALKSKTLHCF